jgi:CBS domain-containing protein
MRAADVMIPDPVCISPDASITDAIQLMLERKFSDLPAISITVQPRKVTNLPG